jgi:class 3 adenylate cyclase/pimeloyl-ACP methyl ester carboxylesterase
MEREVRYCTSADGTRIAYSISGEGPALIMCPALWESFSNEYVGMDRYRALERGRTIIRYDTRGVGLSQRDAHTYTLDAAVEDLEAVVDSAGLDRLSIWASVLSTSTAIVYAVRHPERVARLILTRIISSGEEVMTRENLEGVVSIIQSNWELGSQIVSDTGVRANDPDAGIAYAEVGRQNVGPEAAAAMLTGLYNTIDIVDVLKDVACPTLIIGRRDDNGIRFVPSQHAASVIPHARLTPLPGSGPITVGDDAIANVAVLTAFLDEDPETRALPAAEEVVPRSDSTFRTVLFTDLVGHTEMMSRLGDDRGRDVLREHERITREVLKSNGGTEVKTMGDGFMASFGSVTRAVECAIALQRAFANHDGEPLHVRVGLNAGEPIGEDGDLFGATVILASRIAAKAEGGEILVADTVRGLCSGKGFLFADRGEFVAKGLEEPVRIYEVNWRS